MSDIYIIPQVNNLEDELVYSTSLKNVKQLCNSKRLGDFKRDFLNSNNLGQKLDKFSFRIDKIWSRRASNEFSIFDNDGHKIKSNETTTI